MFFGPKLSTVFASRWKAVTWALGIMLTAYCSIPAADEMQQTAKREVAAKTAKHKSPWAKDQH